MSEKAQNKRKLFATLDPQSYERAPVPSKEAIRAALKKGSDELRMAAAQPRAVKIDPKRRFR